jgi:hypothetical protein
VDALDESSSIIEVLGSGRVPRVAKIVLLAAAFLQVSFAQTFDVASIRESQFQSAGGEGNGRETIQTSADGLTMRNVTLKSCISWAYGVQDFQVDWGT